MSDRDLAPDPIDTAYVQAEAMLSDADARAARRARVLAAVAREPAALPAPPPRPARWNGGWLAAASVVGLSVFVATRLYTPAPPPRPAALPLAPPAVAIPPVAAPPPPSAAAVPPDRAARAFPAAPRAFARPPADAAPAPPTPFSITPGVSPAAPPVLPPVVAAPAPAANLEGGFSGGPRDEAVGARGAAPMTAKSAAIPSFGAPPAAAPVAGYARSKLAPSDDATRLCAAAAAGRTGEVETLLAHGVPVDAADAEGETALMQSIQADHPAVAALLRRHGASLERRNHAGVRARDMATAKADPALDWALGLEP